MRYGLDNNTNSLIPIKPADIIRKQSKRIMRSSVILPSQYQSYSVCVEFAKNWFLKKFPDNYFNSIYVEGTHSFDEFRKFSDIDQKLKRTNPICAIIPSIDMTHNRQWIDSVPEVPLMMKRSKIENSFLIDKINGLYLQLLFKTILMNFTFKVRVNTRAEQLDMVEFIKLNHRAGWTESKNISVDIHVPKQIMLQIAYDHGFRIINNDIENPMKLLEYLNKHSYIPFMYKLRCSTGNKEFFIKLPNCCAHLKMEIPTMDDGERQDMINTNYNIDFAVEVEMTAPYCYTYFSEASKHGYLNQFHKANNSNIAIMSAMKIEIPDVNCNGWDLFTVTEYISEEDELNKEICIDFSDLFHGHDIEKIINYTKAIAISPSIFINFIIFNGDFNIDYEMNWDNMICRFKQPIVSERTAIAIYCDKKYINDAIIYLNELDKKTARVE